VHGPRLEQCTDNLQRLDQILVPGVGLSSRCRSAGEQAKQQSHRRRLPDPARPQEPGYPARLHGEPHMIDGHLVPVALGQIAGLDHGAPPPLAHRALP
jgi:hypothetical protein